MCTNVCVLFYGISLFFVFFCLALSPMLFVLFVVCNFSVLHVWLEMVSFCFFFPSLVALMREVHNELEAIRQEERNICNLDGMTGNLDKSESDNIHLYVYLWRLYLLCFSPFLHNAPFTLSFKSGMFVYCQNAILLSISVVLET